jgi:hypothetical protein
MSEDRQRFLSRPNIPLWKRLYQRLRFSFLPWAKTKWGFFVTVSTGIATILGVIIVVTDVKDRLFPKKPAIEQSRSEVDLKTPILSASAILEVRLSSENSPPPAGDYWDQGAQVIFGNKTTALLQMVSTTSKVSGQNKEVIINSELKLNPSLAGFNMPIQMLKEAAYIMFQSPLINEKQMITGGRLVVLLNNNQPLEFKIPPQPIVKNGADQSCFGINDPKIFQ